MDEVPMPVPPMVAVPAVCPKCHLATKPDQYFCPNCGTKLSDPPMSVTTFTQVWIYLLSVLAPPLGLWPGVKYLKSPDPAAKRIGMIAIVLTVLSTIITLWLTLSFVNSYVNDINQAFSGTGF